MRTASSLYLQLLPTEFACVIFRHKADIFGFWPAQSACSLWFCLLLSLVSVRNLLKAPCWPLATPYCILFPVKVLTPGNTSWETPKETPRCCRMWQRWFSTWHSSSESALIQYTRGFLGAWATKGRLQNRCASTCRACTSAPAHKGCQPFLQCRTLP